MDQVNGRGICGGMGGMHGLGAGVIGDTAGKSSLTKMAEPECHAGFDEVNKHEDLVCRIVLVEPENHSGCDIDDGLESSTLTETTIN